jgi:hypothetical protein
MALGLQKLAVRENRLKTYGAPSTWLDRYKLDMLEQQLKL